MSKDKVTLEDIIMMAKALDSAALPKGTRLYWCPKDTTSKPILWEKPNG